MTHEVKSITVTVNLIELEKIPVSVTTYPNTGERIIEFENGDELTVSADAASELLPSEDWETPSR